MARPECESFILASDHNFMLQGARSFSEKVRSYF